jgi:DUF1365 family protein
MVKILKKPHLIKGDIYHKRMSPKINEFKYQSIYICSPLSKIDKLKKAVFSLEKFNIFSLSAKNYGFLQNKEQKNKNFNDWAYKILFENNIKNIAEIVLVTHPKIMGYVFNPVSFWLCFDENQDLIAVLCEVSNTAGQKHCYLCFNSDQKPIQSKQWLQAGKAFYVSPFLKIEGQYKFRFEVFNDKLNFYINYFVNDELKLITYLKCTLLELNNKNLLIFFFKIPFATLKTVFLIHYQALKLYFKKIKFYKYPKELKNKITLTSSNKSND